MQLNLGIKIRELRYRDGRTQETLAEALGVTSQAVSRWESGGSYPDMEMIPSIANYFGVTIDEGYSVGGEYGPYIQSERSFIYNTVIYEMVLKGLAYPCFCSSTDLEKIREVQTANKERPG